MTDGPDSPLFARRKTSHHETRRPAVPPLRTATSDARDRHNERNKTVTRARRGCHRRAAGREPSSYSGWPTVSKERQSPHPVRVRRERLSYLAKEPNPCRLVVRLPSQELAVSWQPSMRPCCGLNHALVQPGSVQRTT